MHWSVLKNGYSEENNLIPNFWCLDLATSIWNIVKSILSKRKDILDEFFFETYLMIFQKILVRAFTIDKICLPLATNTQEDEKWSNIISTVIWNWNNEIEYVNYWYIKATWLDKISNGQWEKVLWSEKSQLNILEKIKLLSKTKIIHKKYWEINMLYALIYDDETLERVVCKVNSLEKWPWYVDEHFKMKLTWRTLIWNTIKNQKFGWSVRTWLDVTDIEWFNDLLKSNTSWESNFNFQKNVTSFQRWIMKTLEDMCSASIELLIFDQTKEQEELFSNIDIRTIDEQKTAFFEKFKQSIDSIENIDLKKRFFKIINCYTKIKPDTEDDDERIRLENIEKIKEEIIKSCLKEFWLTQEIKNNIAKKLNIWQDSLRWLSKEDNKKIQAFALKNEKVLDSFQKKALQNVFEIIENIIILEKKFEELDKYATIWDIIVNFWPILVHLVHNNEYFHNKKFTDVIQLTNREIDNLIVMWSFWSRIYWDWKFEWFLSSIDKLPKWESLTNNAIIKRQKDWDLVDVLLNWHKCSNAWSKVFVWITTSPLKKIILKADETVDLLDLS
ncbi:MAG: hypothetical protein ACD_4C00234G0004 [uncultured bacterium (gcode 4)]|uniref:Uncharacterized protein n=1 Tax=uncultured bacterium (gcode 4) TaxID=1234023 RepID=K2F698_9BACT|nr:MAG: hypothetical protein ACD_4C00234G0004 [uncultured bacterium (gcode 4)]